MIWASHALMGAAAWMGVSALTGWQNGPAEVAVAAAGALLPDVDEPRSWVGQRLWWISLPFSAVFGHRTLSHSLIGWAIAAALAFWWLSPQWAVPLVLGFGVHLLGDMMTGGPNPQNRGIPLLWPWAQRMRVPVLNFRTFSQAEFLAVWPASGLVIFLTWPRGTNIETLLAYMQNMV